MHLNAAARSRPEKGVQDEASESKMGVNLVKTRNRKSSPA
jgi:hypothetical protein